MSILNKDIDILLIQYLDIDDMRNLYQVNKYYHNLLKNILTNFIDFYSKVNTIELPLWIIHNKLFNKAIIFGKLDVCQYLLKKYNNHINDKSAFELGCQNGHLNIAQWLYSLEHVHADNEYAFRLSCRNGHINVAQWLFSLGNVNIHAYNEYIFKHSCENGHLNVAKWLFSLGNVNIHINNDYAFRYSCRYNCIDVAQWLCSIESRYHINIFNGKIECTID